MKKEFDKYLVESFPNLYKDRHADMSVTCMCWGFECGDGWFDIIKELSTNLESEILKETEQNRDMFRASQVKQKLGSLRFYLTHYTPKMEELIFITEKISQTVCESCGRGNATQRKKSGYIYVSCDECDKNRK